MSAISEFMRADHRRCDATFSELENLAESGQHDALSDALAAFKKDFLEHFAMEEEIMFPAIEQKTGMSMGPTQVMRMEHEQMRHLMGRMEEALKQGNTEQFLGLSETFMILVQQHNMKEEQILYTMADNVLAAENVDIVERMKAI